MKENKISSKEFFAYNSDIQNLKKPLLKGLWLSFPGKDQNFQEMVDHSLGAHKGACAVQAAHTHIAKAHHKSKGHKRARVA